VYFDSVSNIQVTASTIEVTCSATKTGVENSYVITQINGVGGGTGTFGGEVASYAGHSTGSSQNGHVSGIITSTADANGYSITKNSNNNWPDNVLDMRAQTVGGIATPYGLLALYTTPSLGLQNAVDAASSGDTIIAGPGTYRENVVIDKSLDLSGAGSGNTIVDGGRGSGGPSGRVFEISPSGATVTLSGMKIQNGFALWDWGGGIYNSGSLTINDAIISGNIGQAGGGGIFNSGTLTMNGGKITGNAGMVGGGIYNSGFLTINGATILGNHAAMSGGGVANCGTLTLTDTIISGNTPDDVFP
jgi:hypothetical protein